MATSLIIQPDGPRVGDQCHSPSCWDCLYKTCDVYFLESWRIPAAYDSKNTSVVCRCRRRRVREAAEWRWHIPRWYREYSFAPSGFPAQYLHWRLVDLPVMQRPLFTAVTVAVVTFPLWHSSLLQVTIIRDQMSCIYVSQPSFVVYCICQCDWPSVHRISIWTSLHIPMCLVRT